MIIDRVSYTDYNRISRENDYYLWHFLPSDKASPFGLRSIVDGNNKGSKLITFLEYLKIPYFESETKESVDFLIDLGIKTKGIWDRGYFLPMIIGFKGKRMISSTLDTCYCIEGLVDLVAKMDIRLLENINFD